MVGGVRDGISALENWPLFAMHGLSDNGAFLITNTLRLQLELTVAYS
jgi:hypothetical protein